MVRDGTAYALGGTEWSMNDVQPGTTWRMHVEIADRGQSMKLYIDGTLVAEGTETKDEPRRTVTVSRSGERGETYVRVVNAMLNRPKWISAGFLPHWTSPRSPQRVRQPPF